MEKDNPRSQKIITIINGPNLNLLGYRETSIYGTTTMDEVLSDMRVRFPNVAFDYRQSNHEGQLIDWIQQISFSCENCLGIILNAGGYSHNSISLRDTIIWSPLSIVEVHISDISRREPFRQKSILSDVCQHSIIGKGTDGYILAAEWLINVARNLLVDE